MIDKNGVLQFMKQNGLCVLATANKAGKTEAAVMAYVVKDSFTILMNTEPNTRKYAYLLENPQVSVVIGGWKDDPTIQIDGRARVLENVEAESAKIFMKSVCPELIDHLREAGKFLEIKTKWVRYSDFSQNPPEILELVL